MLCMLALFLLFSECFFQMLFKTEDRPMCVKIHECIQITESHENYLWNTRQKHVRVFCLKHPNCCDRKIVIVRGSCGGGAVLFGANFQFHVETPAQCACTNSPQSAHEGSKVLAVHVQTEWCEKTLFVLSLSLSLSLCLPKIQTTHVAGPMRDIRTDDLSFSFFSIFISLVSGFVLEKCSYHILPLTPY